MLPPPPVLAPPDGTPAGAAVAVGLADPSGAGGEVAGVGVVGVAVGGAGTGLDGAGLEGLTK